MQQQPQPLKGGNFDGFALSRAGMWIFVVLVSIHFGNLLQKVPECPGSAEEIEKKITELGMGCEESRSGNKIRVAQLAFCDPNRGAN